MRRSRLEVWFYHLQNQPFERALPALIEKALERGWRVVVQTSDDLRVKALDDLLWSYAPESFLPHAPSHGKAASRQPIVVTREPDNANDAALRIFVEGSEVSIAGSYKRIILLFDGRNEAELDAARHQWSRLKGQGTALAYWQQTEAGRWERRM